jgi:uracil-DNA glycosylase
MLSQYANSRYVSSYPARIALTRGRKSAVDVTDMESDLPAASPQSAAIALLRWWRDAGVTDSVSDTPQSWLMPPPAEAALAEAKLLPNIEPDPPLQRDQAANAPPQPVGPAPKIKPLFSDAALRALPSLAHIGDLASLRQMIEADFDGCALKRTATQLVFCDGNPRARVMLIGEAPGAEEDRTGKPFVGEAGQLLDKMLGSIGLDRKAEDPARAVYITNAVLWRPPGNRTPTPEEMLACLPLLLRHIELINPAIIVALGAVPFQVMVNANEGITRARGQLRTLTIGASTYPLLPTLHPAYLLRQPGQKANSWQDLLALKSQLV